MNNKLDDEVTLSGIANSPHGKKFISLLEEDANQPVASFMDADGVSKALKTYYLLGRCETLRYIIERLKKYRGENEL